MINAMEKIKFDNELEISNKNIEIEFLTKDV